MIGTETISTFVGEGGNLTSTIIWNNVFDLFEVNCVEECEGVRILNTTFLKNEEDAQTYAENFVWRK